MPRNTVKLFEHFGKLTDFSGRESRASFWPYAALIFGLVTVVHTLITVPIMMSNFQNIREFAEQNPDKATVTSGQGHYAVQIDELHPELMSDVSGMIWGTAIAMALGIIFYAAAVARRLHDTNRSGWWGMMPVPFAIFSMTMMGLFFDSFESANEPDLKVFFAIFFSNMLYLIGLIWLIVLLATPSDDGRNKYDTHLI